MTCEVAVQIVDKLTPYQVGVLLAYFGGVAFSLWFILRTAWNNFSDGLYALFGTLIAWGLFLMWAYSAPSYHPW